MKYIFLVSLFFIAIGLYAASASFGGSMYYDVSSSRFGLGTSTPASILHVADVNGATTTIDVGPLNATSKSCINMRTNTGGAVSLYVRGTTLIIEAKRCL